MPDLAASTAAIEELVRYVVDALVDVPESVRIESQTAENNIKLVIQADPDDVGKIIGRGGRTIKSIRTLARASVGTPSVFVDIDVEG
ncbi:MAG: KH domain-containing protein [Actinomycetes bacterium]|jgi:predicted RNA-binding protein YlqC (UPF0109 family)|nr:KH domain-containing protein [Actinomycetes bacterium]